MRQRIIWWVVFILSTAPSVVLVGAYFGNPFFLGVDPAEAMLQETGEWALRFLLLTLLCSPLKRLGFKKILRYRRMLGLFAFYYASLHLLTYLLAWIQLDWVVFIEDLTKRPFIYLGMCSWLILLLLAITSPKRVVKLIKKAWSPIHKFVYLAIILVWVHLWMQSRASASEAVFYGSIVALVLIERLYRKIIKGTFLSSSKRSYLTLPK